VISKYTIRLALDTEAALPTEFRLFIKGWNDTENGRFLFDDAAAKSVMAAYKTWGVDLNIDLEHQSLEVKPGAPDPTARDARGWCKLELRSDGSLWAVGVKWTPDGAARLTNKTQRYVSPAFETDPKTNRILKMLNVAIVAMPATHNPPALVAASRSLRKMSLKKLRALATKLSAAGLDADLIKQAL
jgi:phage I-like protein